MRPINAQNIVSLSDFKTRASKMLNDLNESHCPLVITQNGKAAGVLVSPTDFDLFSEQTRFVESVKQGLADVKAGRIISDEDLDREL